MPFAVKVHEATAALLQLVQELIAEGDGNRAMAAMRVKLFVQIRRFVRAVRRAFKGW